MNKKKTCLFCNKPLNGRSDKKFCDEQCKSAFHNKNIESKEAYIRFVNKQLRTNRSALRKACPEGKATVRKQFLISLGMNFTYCTHNWKSNNGNTYFFCYDYGYTNVDNPEKVLIIQQQSYMLNQ
ncbi:MAG: hypothetical protein JW717_01440 [Marinilabiliaceae bacterium]|nr:hypothetical protein [Marinilabiliaceae bacterium]